MRFDAGDFLLIRLQRGLGLLLGLLCELVFIGLVRDTGSVQGLVKGRVELLDLLAGFYPQHQTNGEACSETHHCADDQGNDLGPCRGLTLLNPHAAAQQRQDHRRQSPKGRTHPQKQTC